MRLRVACQLICHFSISFYYCINKIQNQKAFINRYVNNIMQAQYMGWGMSIKIRRNNGKREVVGNEIQISKGNLNGKKTNQKCIDSVIHFVR